MVTIVNGSALGLQSSLTGTRSNVGSNVQGQNPDQVYVNSATGNLIIQDQDEILSSVGSGLSVVRTYNSQGGFDDPSGNNWRLSVEQRVFGLTGTVNTAGSTIIKEFGDGSQITYTYNTSLGLYTAALGTGADDTLSYNSGNSTWTWTDGTTRATEQYNSSGQMTLCADSSNNVTHYFYTGTLLTQITDPSGQTTSFDYSGNNLVDIKEVSNGVTQKRVQYTYDSSNRLLTVAIDLTPANNSSSDPTYVTTYTYQGTTDLLASITQNDGTTVSFQYVDNGGNYSVSQVTDGDGNVTTFSYAGSFGSGAATPPTPGLGTPQLLGTNSAAPTNALTQQVGFDINGDGTAVWYNNGQVLASHYDKASNTWQTPVVVGTGAIQGQLALSVDGSGFALLAWVSQSGQVYESQYDANTQTWSTAQSLGTGGSGGGTISNLSVAYAEEYPIYAVGWIQSNHAYVSTNFEDAGWSTPQVIDLGNGSSAQAPRSLSLSVSSAAYAFFATWVQDAGSGPQIYTNDAVYSGDWSTGYVWDTAAPFAGATSNDSVQLLFDGLGNGIGAASLNGQVVFTYLNGSTGEVSAPAALYSGPGTPSGLSLAIDKYTGNAVLSWVQTNSGVSAVYADYFDAASGSWSGAAQLSTAVTPSADGTTTTAIRNGQAVVGWLQRDPSGQGNDLMGALWSGGWSSPAQLSTMAGSSGVEAFASLAIDQQGNVAAVWSQANTAGTASNLYVNRYNAGSPWSAPQRLGDTSDGTAAPVTAFNAAGNGVAVWYDGSNLVGRAYNKATNTWGATQTIANDALMAPESVSVDGAGNVLLAWGGGTGQTVTISQYSAATGAWSTAQTIGSVSGGTVANIVTTRYATGSKATVAWTQNNRVYVSSWSGSSWSAPTAVDSGNGSQSPTDLSVAIDSQGGTHLVWTQSDGTALRVYTNAATSAGVWGTASVLSSTADAGTEPKIAFDTGTDGVAAWTTGTQVMVSRYNFTNGTWGTATAVGTGYTATDSLSLALDAATGNAVMIWTAATFGSQQPYASYYSQSTSSWSTPAQLNSVYLVNTGAGYTTASIQNGHAVVSWEQADPTGEDSNLMISSWSGGGWGASQQLSNLVDYRGDSKTSGVTVDAQGRVTAVWSQEDRVVGGYHLYVNSNNQTASTTTVTDALGNVTTYTQNGAGRLTSVATPLTQTNYTYDTNGDLLTVTRDPSGLNETTTYTYDNNGNLLSSVDALGNTVTYTYSSDNKLLTRTGYLVPAAGSTAASAPITTRYVYDGSDRLRFSISAVGDVTEYRYNGLGQRSSQLVYGGADVYNIAGLSATAAPTLAQMTSWVSGLSQTQNQSIDRTDYTYDFRGNLSTATVYDATSTSGVGAGTASTTQYVYDQRGLLLQVIDPRGSATAPNVTNPNPAQSYATTYTYDGLGRLLDKTQWFSATQGGIRTIHNVYTTNTIQTTAANGLVTTRVYDQAGHLISVANSGPGPQALGTTIYQYDADGRLAITTDPTGDKQYIIYDVNGRQAGEVDVSADVDGRATLTQYVYDNVNELVKTVRYADYLSAATVATLTDSSGKPASVSIATLVAALPTTVGRAFDQITRSVYDLAGRKVYDIDAMGDVAKYVYDGAGRLTSQTQYATPVSIAASVNALTPGQVGVTASPGNDRQTSYFYDNDGRLVGALDARGYLTQSIYDAAGLLIEKIAYAVAAPTVSYSGGQWSNLPAATFAQDVVSAYFYDAEGNLVGTFASAGANTAGTAYSGYFTRTQYDTNRNIAAVTQYAQALTYTAGTSTDASLLATAQAAAAVPGASAAHVTSYQYNGINQVTQETNFEGTITNYVYDTSGNLISQTVAVNSTIPNDTRTTQFKYDLLGRVTAQLSAAGSALLTGNLTQTQIAAIWAEYGTSYTYDDAGRRTSQTVTAYNPTTGTTQTETTEYFYNEAGQLRFTMNALGEVTENQYNALGQVTAQVNYYQRVTNPAALTGGLLTSTALGVFGAIANAANAADSVKDKKTTYTYKLNGKVATQTTVEGGSVTYGYDAFGEVNTSTTVVDASQGTNLVRNFFYDLDGDLFREQSDPTGANQVLTYGYDAFDRQTSVTDQYGNKTSTQYDSLGRIIATTDAVTNAANGSTGTATSTKTSYDAFSRVLTTTDASGNVTQYKYDDIDANDSLARSVTVTTPEGVSVTTHRDRNGETLTVTSATNTTSYTYNLDGEVTSISDNLGTLESRQYDSVGREVSDTDANSTVTTFGYDAANRVLTRTVDPSGLNLTTSYAYDGEGRTMTTTSANGVVTKTQYDADGRVYQVAIDPAGLNIVTQYNYNNEGDVVTLTQGLGSSNPRVTQYTYDALGRRTKQVVDPGTGNNPATGQPYLNLTTRYFYDANSNLTQTIDANGNSTWYVYDPDNRVHYTVNALGGITETDYDGNGRVSATRQYATATTPPASTVHQITVTPVTSGADRLTRHYYDADGNEVYTIDAAETVTQRTFDINGNVIQLRVIATTTAAEAQALTTAATTAAVTQALGSAATTLGAADRVQWTAYDARGRAIVNIDALGDITQTQYDGDGNVVSTTAYATAITPPATLVTSISANVPASGPPQIIVNGNTSSPISVASSANDRQTRYWYDTAGRQVFTLSAAGYLTRTQYNDAAYTRTVTVYATPQTIPTGTTTSQLQTGAVAITTTPVGQTVEADQTTKTFYDAAGRVSHVTDALGNSESYTYDALGNKLTYTNKNQQNWTYKYDAAGRLIEEDSPYVSVSNVTASGGALTATPVTASIVTLMTYDGLGNVSTLTEGIERQSNGTEITSNSRQTTYGYDALGRQTSVSLSSVPVYNGIGTDTVVVSESGAAIGSNSTMQPVTTQVVYDTLGNEIASKDAGNNWTYKVYDQLGRVLYQIDALNFVTGYAYDAFGNQLTTTRFNTHLSTTATGSATASITASTLLGLQVTSTDGKSATIAVTNSNGAGSVTSPVYVVAASGQDRTITTSYDVDNRVSQVSQPQVFSFDLTLNESGGQQPAFNAAPTVKYIYNAFGQVVRTATLVNQTGTGSWAYTFTYYDQVGNKKADINPDGYLNTYQYDAEGNLTSEYEYAQKLAVDDTTSTTTVPNGVQTPNDRQTQYQYDQLNRKVTQTLTGIITGNGTGPQSVTTSYGYDALGNQTSVSANGATTYTYYDVLGRVIATVGPAPGDNSSVTPLTLMQRDVYGNLVAQTLYAAGFTGTVNSTPTTANTSPDANKDRTTLYLRDVEGHVLETEQLLTSVNSGEGSAINNIYTYDAYDARGNLVKQYQPANATDTLVTFYTYDALGRETDVIAPELVGSASQISDQFTDYDAFGEVKGKGTMAYSPGAQKIDDEVFYYDQAGRVFLSNSQGAYAAYLYDLAGNATGMFQEQTADPSGFNLFNNLSAQSSAQSAYAAYSPSNTDGLLFTQTVYDAMGNVLETILPTYSTPNPIEALTNTGVQVAQNANGTYYLSWFAPADSTLTPTLYIDGVQQTYQHVPETDGTGNEYGYQAEYVLSGFANGPHTYLIQYTRPTLDVNGNPLIAAETTGTFNIGESLSPIVTANPGTVSNVNAALSGTNLLVSWVPDNTSVSATISILVGGTWQNATGTINESGIATASLTAPAPGTYQYRITDALTGATEAQGTGTITIPAPTTTTSLGVSAGVTGTVTSVISSVSGSNAFVSWQADSNVTSASFQILIGGTWTTYGSSLSESGLAGVSFALPAAGTYQYRIVDQVQGMTEAQATGTIAFTAPVTTTSLNNNTVATEGTVNGLSAAVNGSTAFVSWTPDMSGTTAVFSILVGGVWTNYSPTLSESGQYTASFALPAAGTYQYRVTDFVSSGDIEAQDTGTISFTAATTSTTLTNSPATEGTVGGVSSAVNGSTAFVSWTPDIAGTTAVFSILIGGTWQNYAPTLSESGQYTASFALPAAGTYQYRITDFANGDTEAQGTGTISFTAATTTGSLSNNTVATEGTISGVSSVVGGTLAVVNWTPDMSGTTGVFSILVGGTWTNYSPTVTESGQYQVSFTRPAAGTYQYRIADLVSSNEPEAQGTGTITFTASGSSISTPTQIVAVTGFTNLGNGVLGWNTAANSGDTIVFRYKAFAASTWAGTLPVSGSSPSFSVNLTGLSGTIEYEVDYISSGAAFPYKVGHGAVIVGSSTTPAGSGINTLTQLSTVTGFADRGGGVFGWNTAANSGDSVVFRYKTFGASTWTGTLAVSGSSPSYSVNLSGLSGTIEYQVEYIASGAAQPYRVGRGAVTIATSTTPPIPSINTQTQIATVTGFASLGNGVLGWNTAANSGDSIVFRYKPFAASTWSGTLPVSGSSPSYSVNLSALSGTIEYEVEYTASGGAQPYRVGHGAVTIQTGTTQGTAQVNSVTELLAVSGVTDQGNGILGWNTPANAGDTIVFHYKVPGASTWAGTLPVSGSSPAYSVNLSSLSGPISYEIDYIASGASQPYRVGWGAVTITRTTNSGTPVASAAVNLSAISGFQDLGNGVLGWSTAANNTDTIQFHYKAVGATTWANTITVPPTGPYSVNLAGLSGTIAYELDYIASGAAQPYRVETGTVTINAGMVSLGPDTTASSLPPTQATPVESQTVDRWGNILSSTNADHKTTSYTYNRYDELLTTTDPTVTTVAVAMSADGRTGTAAAPNRSSTPTSYNYYDLYGRLVETVDADGNTNTKGYNQENELTSLQDADGGLTTYVYDAFGDQIQVTTHADAQTTYKTLNAYDQAGRLTDTEQELAQNTFTSAMVTGFASSLLPASNVNVIRTQYRYDQAGRRIASVDGAGEATLTGYDLHGNVTSTTTALGATTSYGYDLLNNKTSATDPDSNHQSWTYDYFGRLLNHTDLGGTISTYTYDTNGSGLLIHLTSTGGQFAAVNQTYSYDTANHLVQIDDTGVNSTTTYSYDGAGRIERQQTSILMVPATGASMLAEDTSTEYDALGRIANISGLGYSVSYSYDAAGNRTNIDAWYTTSTNHVSRQDYWYGYDKMNRVVISEGQINTTNNTFTASSSQGTILTYDWRGDRTSATTQATDFPLEFLTVDEGTTYATFGTDTDMAYYAYTYDGAGRLTTTTVRPWTSPGATPAQIDARQYDQASRITQETTLTVTKGVQGVADNTPETDVQTNIYNADGTLNETLTTQNGLNASVVDYHWQDESGTWHSGYDAAGNLKEYTNYVYDPDHPDSTGHSPLLYTSTNFFSYYQGDSYLESQQFVANSGPASTTPSGGSTNYTYNADQQLIQFTDNTKPANNRAFLNNVNGQVLTVALGTDGKYGATGTSSTSYGSDPEASTQFEAALMAGNAFFQDTNAQYFFYDSKGNSVGTFGNLAGNLTANFDVNFTPISQQYPAQEPPQYVVEVGDTLASIAARVYGDASLWYIIAQANGLTGSGPGTASTVGVVGTGPNDVLTVGTALTIPNVVVALPNSAQSFKPFSITEALGNTNPYQAPPPPPQAGGGCGIAGMIVGAIVEAVIDYFAPYLYVLAAAVGNAIGQEVNVALGEQSSFSWAEVGESAAAAIVTGGGEGADVEETIPEMIGHAVVQNAVTQGVAIAFGTQKSFNWLELAASAVAAPIAETAGKEVGASVAQGLGNSFAAQVVGNFVGQVTAGEINSLTVATFSGGRVDYAEVAADAFGTAIGNSLVQALLPPKALSGVSNFDASRYSQNSTLGQLTLESLGTDGSAYQSDESLAENNPTASNVDTAAGSTPTATTDALTKNADVESLFDGQMLFAANGNGSPERYVNPRGVEPSIFSSPFPTAQDTAQALANDSSDAPSTGNEVIDAFLDIGTAIKNDVSQGVTGFENFVKDVGSWFTSHTDSPAASSLPQPSHQEETNPPPLPITDQGPTSEIFPAAQDLNPSPPPLTAGEPNVIGPTTETLPPSDMLPNILLSSPLTPEQFDDLSYDPNQKKITPGAVEEIRAAQAAQNQGLLPPGDITRGDTSGVDLNVGGTPVSIKAFRDDSILDDRERFLRLAGTLQADKNVQFLIDARNLTDEQLTNITNALVQKGVDPSRFVVPSHESYGPIRIVNPDGTVVNR